MLRSLYGMSHLSVVCLYVTLLRLTQMVELFGNIFAPSNNLGNWAVARWLGWRGGLVVGRRTCDLVVAGSRPGRDAAA